MGKIATAKPKSSRRNQKENDGTPYTRRNRKTGKIYTAKLCNPCKTSTEKQRLSRTNFGILNSAVNKWIALNRDNDTEIYRKVMTKFKRQNRYKLLRGFIVGTNMATLQPDGTILITTCQ